MMKKLLLSLAVVACCAAPLPATSAEPAPAAESRGAWVHLTYMEAIITTLDTLTDLLGTVTDKASADKAAPSVKLLLEATVTLSKTATRLGEPDGATPADLRKVQAMEKTFQTRVAEFEKTINSLPLDSLNSQSFVEALQVAK